MATEYDLGLLTRDVESLTRRVGALEEDREVTGRHELEDLRKKHDRLLSEREVMAGEAIKGLQLQRTLDSAEEKRKEEAAKLEKERQAKETYRGIGLVVLTAILAVLTTYMSVRR